MWVGVSAKDDNDVSLRGVMDRRQEILQQDGTDPEMRKDNTKKVREADEVGKDVKDSQLYVNLFLQSNKKTCEFRWVSKGFMFRGQNIEPRPSQSSATHYLAPNI